MKKKSTKKKKLLLHVCCAPCSTKVIEDLEKEDKFEITLYFYNPNIEPKSEYDKRLKDVKRYAKFKKLKLALGYYTEEWLDAVKGHEKDPEGGPRCEICFRFRLEKVAKVCKDNGYDCFATTLPVSPYKNSILINRIGHELADKFDTKYIERDYRKNDGFGRSIELSLKHNMYRQTYCGCLFAKEMNH